MPPSSIRTLVLRTIIAAALFATVPLGDLRAQEQQLPAAAAQQDAPEQKPGWTVHCDNAGQGMSCKAVQAVVLAKTRQLLLSLAVSKPAESDDLSMLLQLPHGLFIPAGIAVAVDSATPQKLDIQTCDSKGCYAGMPIKADQLAAMKSGQTFNVVFQDLKKQNITVPAPLRGFEDALKKL